MAGYVYNGPIHCEQELKLERLKGKTAIVTGGANGIGEAYVRALVTAGLSVVFGDLDVKAGSKLESELSGTKFVQCNVTKWEDQTLLFREAAKFSPSGKVSYVVANAGVAPKDDVFSFSGKDQEPVEPNLSTIDINLKGTLYTTKLAIHYFVQANGQTPSESQEDTCLVLVGSGAAYVDVPRGPVYPATKWANRGIMHSLRRTTFYYGSRVNMISPWYVKTKILSEETFQQVKDSGVEFATVEDAGKCLLAILSNTSMNGHSLFVSARKWASQGFLDLDYDDYPGNALMQEIQVDQMKSAPVSRSLFLN